MNIAMTTAVVPYVGTQAAFFPVRRAAYPVDHPYEHRRDSVVIVLGDEADGTYGAHGRPVWGSRNPEYVNLYV